MKTVRIAMCQIFCLDGDRRGNFVRIENAIRDAKDAGADIACLPETTLLGWVNPEAHKRAHAIPGPDSDRLCRLATDHDIHLCVGLAEKDGKKLYDSVLLIDNDGQILLKHRKINLLSELMSPPYTAGNSVNAVETEFGKIGLLICADTHEGKIL
ncbi:MAG: carbon-nitrogen hydrolase family protein, partial [Planctomycetota bacterium]